MSIQLGQIVEILGGKLHGDATCEIKGLASLLAADASQISFVSNQKYEQQLGSCKAACVIVGPKLETKAKARVGRLGRRSSCGRWISPAGR